MKSLYMKTKISNMLVGLLVNAYMTITVVAMLFEKGKKKRKKAPHNDPKPIAGQPSISKG